MDDNDAEAIAWSLAGDRDAFLELFNRHASAVHGYLSRRGGVDNADDLLAEVWLQAFRSRSTYDGHYADARPWLYGIARNVLRAHWRIQSRLNTSSLESTFDPWAEVDARIAALELAEPLRRALSSLSDDEREVLLLVAWEHLSPTQAAVVLNIPPGTARSRLHRARSLVRAEIGASPPRITRLSDWRAAQ